MAALNLTFFGPLHIYLNGEPVSGLESNKVRALLIYLVSESHRPHTREKLAELLWPYMSEDKARANLRHVLANLRRALGDQHAAPPYLLISRQTIQFNSASHHTVDMDKFLHGLQAVAPAQNPSIHQIEQVVALYQGDFLEDFTFPDSMEFEEWAQIKREYLRQQMMAALRLLTEANLARGYYDQALSLAQQQITLEPWNESAHQQVMKLLALTGQRTAALAQFENCRRVLADEFGVAPTIETETLFAAIRAESWPDEAAGFILPPYLTATGLPSNVKPLVGRQSVLGQLFDCLHKTLEGNGRIIFITGDAGMGKTAHLFNFAQQAMQVNENLLALSGACSAYKGIGDPYLPFLEIAHMLSGDVTAQWSAGAVSSDHASRLWAALPDVAAALTQHGPALIDRFVPGGPFLERAGARALAEPPGRSGWLERLVQLVDPPPGAPAPVRQSDLFEQYTRFLKTVARRHPLLLLLDDLQWIDPGSLSLLFHLGRRLSGSRILIVGALRSGDVLHTPVDKRHALQPIYHELQRLFGEAPIDLDMTAKRPFLDALLDSEANQLDETFRNMLLRQTNANPLFTIELLRELQARGDLVQDDANNWIAVENVNWEILPARVEAVIAERAGQLEPQFRDILRLASLQGPIFTAQINAHILKIESAAVIAALSGPLAQEHTLVEAHSLQHFGHQNAARYRFRHILFQRYFYNSFDVVNRARLHAAVGEAIEYLYPDQNTFFSDLAWHFEEAGNLEKAVFYRQKIGVEALHLADNATAYRHLESALALLGQTPDTPDRDRLELELLLDQAGPAQSQFGYGAPAVEVIQARVSALLAKMGDSPAYLPALFLLGGWALTNGDLRVSYETGEKILHLAHRIESDEMIMAGNWGMGVTCLFRGDFEAANRHLEAVTAVYDPAQHHPLAFQIGHDIGVISPAWRSWVLLILGYLDQAKTAAETAINLARTLDHPFSLTMALNVAGCNGAILRRDYAAARRYNTEALALSHSRGYTLMEIEARFFQGFLNCLQGQNMSAGLEQMRVNLEKWQSLGTRLAVPHMLGFLAQGYAIAGQHETAVQTLEAAAARSQQLQEEVFESEFLRSQGELLSRMGAEETAVVGCFQQAITVAREQRARLFELRAVTSLCRFGQKHAVPPDARHNLAALLEWFPDELETPDLIEARQLLAVY